MPKTPVPCKDCPDRRVGCHAECEKYREYDAALRKDRDKRANIVLLGDGSHINRCVARRLRPDTGHGKTDRKRRR